MAFVSITSFSLMLIERQGVRIAILAIQYAAVAWLSALALPPQVSAVKLVAGLIACGVLALTVAGLRTRSAISSEFVGRSFRALAGVLILAAAIGFGRSNWMRIPDISPEAIMAASVLMAMGLLQLGLSGTAMRIAIGLMTLLSGFEIAYSVVEPALVVLALLASVHIGIATVVSYLLLVAHPPDRWEAAE